MFEHLSSDCYQLVSAYIFLKGQKPTPKHILKKCLEMLYQAISFFSFFWKQKTSLFSLPCRPYSLFFNHFWSIISLGSHLHCLVVNCKSITKLILNSHLIWQSIRMANLSIVCSHTVNGVSRMHSELLKTRVFKVIHQGTLVYPIFFIVFFLLMTKIKLFYFGMCFWIIWASLSQTQICTNLSLSIYIYIERERERKRSHQVSPF